MNILTKEELNRREADLTHWAKTDWHKRGCYFEALAGELEQGMVRKEYVAEILRSIAASVK